MPIISTDTDTNALTLTLVAEFDAEPTRVWQLWSDPRQLERWWGPPTWPATFDALEVRPGGTASYYMTGPDGTKAGGLWEFTAVDEPRSLSFDDRFADENGAPAPDMPVTHAAMRLDPLGDGARTRMTLESRFETLEQLEQLVQMGMAEGLREAVSQIDEILADTR
jgi:uncharacterized protein YndB with AHSA1/START domain